MKGHIKGFDGLRGISIILVIMTHLGLYKMLPEYAYMRVHVWSIISGATGVFIFFSISGFLITNILLNEIEHDKRINFKLFFIKRFVRLFPPLIPFYLIVLALMFTSQIPMSRLGLGLAFVYLYNFIPAKSYTGELGHMWSLGIEEQFYIIWPMILGFLKKYETIVLLTFLAFACVLGVQFLGNLRYRNDLLENSFKVDRWFIPAAAPIIFGSLVAFLNFHYKKIASFFSSNFGVCIGLIFFLFPLIGISSLSKFFFIFQGLLGAALILVWIAWNQNSWLTKVLELSWIKFLGKISYSLYIWQGLFLGTGPGGSLSVQKFPVNIVLAFFCAILSYYSIEKVSTSYRKQLTLKFANND